MCIDNTSSVLELWQFSLLDLFSQAMYFVIYICFYVGPVYCSHEFIKDIHKVRNFMVSTFFFVDSLLPEGRWVQIEKISCLHTLK